MDTDICIISPDISSLIYLNQFSPYYTTFPNLSFLATNLFILTFSSKADSQVHTLCRLFSACKDKFSLFYQINTFKTLHLIHHSFVQTTLTETMSARYYSRLHH